MGVLRHGAPDRHHQRDRGVDLLLRPLLGGVQVARRAPLRPAAAAPCPGQRGAEPWRTSGTTRGRPPWSRSPRRCASSSPAAWSRPRTRRSACWRPRTHRSTTCRGGLHLLHARAGARRQLLRVERCGPLLDDPRRRPGGEAGGLELPGPGAGLRRHPRPPGGVRRRHGPVLRGRRGGHAAARRLLRRLDHQRAPRDRSRVDPAPRAGEGGRCQLASLMLPVSRGGCGGPASPSPG